jgi:alkyl sulfatase BDS1-like metallo-beta-lactamase superfamily hydrolase
VRDPGAGATVRLSRPDLLMTLIAGLPFAPRVESGHIAIEGDASLYAALVGLIEAPAPNFPIVTP